MACSSIDDFWACFGPSVLDEWRAVAPEVAGVPLGDLHPAPYSASTTRRLAESRQGSVGGRPIDARKHSSP